MFITRFWAETMATPDEPQRNVMSLRSSGHCNSAALALIFDAARSYR
jgi:hypothetical protein